MSVPPTERVHTSPTKHIGMSCVPCAAEGERVYAGVRIGDENGLREPVSANISGRVHSKKNGRPPFGEAVMVIEITSDDKGEINSLLGL